MAQATVTRLHQTALSQREVSEVVLTWVRRPTTHEVAEQVVDWQAEQWEAARWAIQVHGIAPLLYARLGPSRVSRALDPLLHTYLADQYRLNKLRVSALMAELAAVLRAAAQVGIDVMPLKGSVLVEHYYADPALRPMADLDVLVRPADEARLAPLLHRLGYDATERTARHRSYILAQTGGKIVSVAGEHPDNPHNLDVHTAIQEQFWGIDYRATEDLWSGCRPGLFGDAPGMLLEPPALLQHLLIHASTDMIACKMRLIRLVDIALVAARLSMTEWQQLVRAGQRRREERLLYAPLLLAERYLGAVAPSEVCATLAQGTPAHLRAYLEHADLYRLSFCNPVPAALGDKLSWYRPGREQLVALRHMLLPTPRELRDAYPRLTQLRQVPLAYLTHGLRVAGWPLRQILHIPRRAWVHRERGGRA